MDNKIQETEMNKSKSTGFIPKKAPRNLLKKEHEIRTLNRKLSQNEIETVNLSKSLVKKMSEKDIQKVSSKNLQDINSGTDNKEIIKLIYTNSNHEESIQKIVSF